MLTRLIQRFEHDKAANSTSKIDVKVQFPLQVNMLPYTSRKMSHGTHENYELARSCIYDLLSVVVHSGGKMHTGNYKALFQVVAHTDNLGHYISYSRVGNQVTIIPFPPMHFADKDEWFKFDDHKVTLATESQVLGAEAFILFYMVRSLA
jgi:ubiquitin carboxyl-terminal hydrolase 22/27/51